MWQSLDGHLLEGVSLAGVRVLRLDRQGGDAPGNKVFKLQPHLVRARARGARCLLSFGGAWSNHLHALAAAARAAGLEAVGVVRGEAPATLSATLADAQRWGMRLHFVSRAEYRRRYEPDYQALLATRLGADYLIPEGAADASGVAGCRGIAELIRAGAPAGARVVLAVGTGTTLAGVVAGLTPDWPVTGVVVLKGDGDLEHRIAAAVAGAAANTTGGASWALERGFHCGGFARVEPRLQSLMLACERELGLPLDPVYTGKAMLALHSLRAAGDWDPQAPLVLVHSGGLQGRRGYSWLC